jgi:polar amino acid transport system permease protein
MLTLKTFAPLIHSYWYLFRGAGMTLLMASSSVVPATLLGILLALGRLFGRPATRAVINVYIFIIRGIPLLVLLTFTYYLLPLTGIDLPPFWGVVLVLGCYYAAFMSEVFRAGIESLPQAQWDAARSLGMSRHMMMRIVIVPQAMRLAAPPYVNLCINLIKATSLVSIIGLWELTMASREVVERTLAPFQIFLAAAAMYFVLCYALALYGRYLERRILVGH